MSVLSISTTEDRLIRLDDFVKKNKYSDRSSFINESIDFYIKHIQARHLTDFMYYIGLPFLMFLITVGLTLYFVTMYFFVITATSGIYCIIFIFLFHNKYRGRR